MRTAEAEVYEVMHGVADQLARAYHARCWWADLLDLRQEAWVAQLEAFRRPTRNPDRPLRPYLYRAAAVHLRNWTLANSSPVSEKQKKLHLLKGTTRAPLGRCWGFEKIEETATAGYDGTTTGFGPLGAPAVLAAPKNQGYRLQEALEHERGADIGIDEKLHTLRHNEALRRRVRLALRQNGNGSPARGHEAAIPVLLGGKAPATVAEEQQIPATEVYRATTNGRRRLRADPEIRRLLRER